MKIYNEIRSINSEIVNPDINISKDITTTNYDGKVYLSLNLIKDVGPSAIEKIIDGQPYSSFEDFCNRCKVNKRVKRACVNYFDNLEYETYDNFLGLNGIAIFYKRFHGIDIELVDEDTYHYIINTNEYKEMELNEIKIINNIIVVKVSNNTL